MIAQVASGVNPRSIIVAAMAPSRSTSTGVSLKSFAASAIASRKAMYGPATPSFFARASIRFAAGSSR